jgi:proton glutamate symport protein
MGSADSKHALICICLCDNTNAMSAMTAQSPRRGWYRPSLTIQIMVGLVVGGLIGWLRPDWGNAVYFLRDIFINLIKSIIAPLVFSTIVVGIAGAGALRKVGRMGIKALIYFEIVTTAALVIGLAVVNLTKPGAGVILAARNTDVLKAIGENHAKSLVETIVHVFPSSVLEAMVRGDVLQMGHRQSCISSDKLVGSWQLCTHPPEQFIYCRC